MKFGGLSYPNAFFGSRRRIGVRTIAVIGTGACEGAALVRDLHVAGRTGRFGLLVTGSSTQSLFVIHALCPWCLTLMFSTTIQFMALSHATVAVQGLPSRKAVAADDSDGEAEVAMVPAGLNKYYRLNIDLMVDILWIVAIVVLIIVTEGAALFAA